MANTRILHRIRGIQMRLGVGAGGIIGPITLTALEKALEKAIGPPTNRISIRNNKRVRDIQARLGLVADGIVGPLTLTALENTIGNTNGIKMGSSFTPVSHKMKISRLGRDKLEQFEISSKSFYNRHLKSPIWPGGGSGVTIGIGYDLGHQSRSKIVADWGRSIADTDLNDLLKVAGIKGSAADRKIKELKHISIPYETAKRVFRTSTLRDWAKRTARIYPGIIELPSDAQAMLLSLVYNRGDSLANNDRRREMRNIVPLVADKDLRGISNQVSSMKRLWIGKGLPGLLDRRDEEARIIRNPRRDTLLPEGEVLLV